MGINELAEICHGAAVDTGWWHDIHTGKPIERNKGELFMLIVTELAEAYNEGVRKGLADKHLPHRSAEEVEMADTVIRLLDYAAAHSLDLEGAIAEKLQYNAMRADHKPANRALAGGKAF